MATVSRHPLSLRPHAQHLVTTISPLQAIARRGSVSKRARSPEPSKDEQGSSLKRFKPVAESPAPRDVREEAKREKERKRAEREYEFRDKYRRAFPGWVFYFDIDAVNPEIASLRDNLERRVLQTGARIDDFFSKDITHLVTLHAQDADKENATKPQLPVFPGALLGSPVKLKGRNAVNEPPVAASDHLVKKALNFGIKVWSATKLDSVLERCNFPASSITSATVGARSVSATKERSLMRLLEDERIHGTSERDPTQKRHDYTYFSKGSFFVLVEDMRQELATIAALEYPITRGRDGKERPTWPIPYCHPKSRGPFVPYDEKEERRRVKVELQDQERERDRERRKAQWREEQLKRKSEARQQAKQHDLRRAASMHNLQRRVSMPNMGLDGLVDLDADDFESVNASGYLASGAYVAASGNSVGITSTVGTTSAVSNPMRAMQLPPGLRDKMQQQVITSRKVTTTAGEGGKENKMGPPLTIPNRANALRKSKSTNTLRLPKREEGVKPGYCESCRVKFEDFQHHIQGRRHRKFAMDDANFAELDFVLSRVRRRTREEVEAEKRQWAARFARKDLGVEQYHDDDDDDDPSLLPAYEPTSSDWEEWADAEDGL